MFRILASISGKINQQFDFHSDAHPATAFREVLDRYDTQKSIFDRMYMAHNYNATAMISSHDALILIHREFRNIRSTTYAIHRENMWVDQDMTFLINNIRIGLRMGWWDNWSAYS
jgi:hypothetical protein